MRFRPAEFSLKSSIYLLFLVAALGLVPVATAWAQDDSGEEPAVEEPVAEEEPAAEEPAVEEEPVAEEPAAEAPAAEEPAEAVAPAEEEPEAEAATTEEPEADAATTEEPAADVPEAEAATTEEPATEEPAADAPVDDQQAAEATPDPAAEDEPDAEQADDQEAAQLEDDFAQALDEPEEFVAVAPICTQDVQACGDGSFVSRQGPNCEFAACPVGAESIVIEQVCVACVVQPLTKIELTMISLDVRQSTTLVDIELNRRTRAARSCLQVKSCAAKNRAKYSAVLK